MAVPQLEDLRLFLHQKNIDHAWLRTVLIQYLSNNPQSDSDIFEDHEVWTIRNTIEEFAHLLDDEPEELEEPEDESKD